MRPAGRCPCGHRVEDHDGWGCLHTHRCDCTVDARTLLIDLIDEVIDDVFEDVDR